MDTRKVLGIIFSILFVGAFTFVLCWGIINFNKVKDSMSSTGVYTEQDVNNAYQDGYDTALQDKQSYDELINSYRDTITTLTDQISQLSSQVTNLTNANKDYSSQITNLENQKSNLESQVENLTTIKTDNEILISDLNVQVANLQSEVSRLENSGYNNEQELAQKNAQITSLQNTITQLQKTNELNVQTINNLNNQVTSLNSQISEMTLQIQNNSTNVSSLNNKIAELEKSVAYYEQYVASLENGEQVVATFEFNGSVYNIQIVNPNSLLSVTTPTSTEYVIFNYWTVNGVEIDLSTYKISQNTKIVADVTYRYKTEFIVNDEVYNSQIVTLNDFATLPTNPNISGYDFDGWTLNGVDIVNPTTIEITEDTKFIAKLTKLHSVKFYCENELIDEQIVRNGNYVEYFEPTLENAIFNGWTVNDTFVDLTTYKIVAETVVIADLKYPEFAVTYKVDNDIVSNQTIVYNNISTVNNTPTKIGYKFLGWSLDGSEVVDNTSRKVTEDTAYIAVFEKLEGLYQTGTYNLVYTWQELLDNSIITMSSKTLNSANAELLVGDLYIPNNKVTTIATKAFESCINLTGVVVPNSVTTLESACFAGCKGLTFISIPFVGKSTSATAPNALVFGWIFGGTEYEGTVAVHQPYAEGYGEFTYTTKYFYIPTNLKTVAVTSGSVLGPSAFYGCSMLENVYLSDTITTIQKYAFQSCSGLKNIKMPSKLRTIYAFAFYCGLENVYLPSTVTSITRFASWGDYAFSSSITIYFGATSCPSACYFKSDSQVNYGYSYADYLTTIGKGY